MSSYVTIDATDPNIAAIRGLASGLVGLASLWASIDVFAAGHLLPSMLLSTTGQFDMSQCDSKDNILASHHITQMSLFSLAEKHLSVDLEAEPYTKTTADVGNGIYLKYSRKVVCENHKMSLFF